MIYRNETEANGVNLGILCGRHDFGEAVTTELKEC